MASWLSSSFLPQPLLEDEGGSGSEIPSVIVRDNPDILRIVDGLDENDQIIVNPSDSLADGMKVHVDTSGQTKQP